MARRFRESDHPRHPRGSSRGGEFREKATGWVGRISDRLALPSAKDILQGKVSNEQMATLGRELEGRYGSGGMTVRNVHVWRVGGDDQSPFNPVGHLEIGGEIVSDDDPDNIHEGYFRVTASQTRKQEENDPLIWRAYIDRMHVRGAAQGGGGGRELTARLVDWFRRSGFDEVGVGPSEIGSYAWGAMGFDFGDFTDRKIAWEGAMTMTLQQVRDHFNWGTSAYGDPELPLTDKQIERMIRQYRWAATRAVAGTMSYQQLSQYGRRPGQGKNDWWAGKLGLIIGGVGSGKIKL